MSDESKRFRFTDIPPDEWIRYMATFYRTLAATVEYVEGDNIEGIWLMGNVLDALHNVPAMLHGYSEEDWNSPSRARAWMLRWSERVETPGWMEDPEEWPNWLMQDCREIFTFDPADNRSILGIESETPVLPPDSICALSLGLLRDWCVGFRYRTSLSEYREEVATADWVRKHHYCLRAVSAGLLPIPLLLTHWSEKAWAEYRELIQVPPNEYPECWHSFFAEFRDHIPTAAPDAAAR